MANNGFEGLGGAVSKRELKIFWLIDTSGSMHGDKIATVNRAIKAVIPELRAAADENPEIQMLARALKFGQIVDWHTSETKIEDFVWHDLDVGGLTPTGEALCLLARELTPERMGSRAIPPVLILLSDGEATDECDEGIRTLLEQKWAKKSVRIAIAIGSDANIAELTKFCSHPNENPPLEAKNASELVKFIKWASVEVSKSVSTSVIAQSSTANVNIPPPPQPQVTIGAGVDQDDDDEVW